MGEISNELLHCIDPTCYDQCFGSNQPSVVTDSDTVFRYDIYHQQLALVCKLACRTKLQPDLDELVCCTIHEIEARCHETN